MVFVEKVFFWEPEKKAIFQLTTEKILKMATFLATLHVMAVLQKPLTAENGGSLGRSPSRAMLSVTGSIMEASGLALSSLSTLYLVQMITNGACGFVDSLGNSGRGGGGPAVTAAAADGSSKLAWEAFMRRMKTAFVGSSNGGPSVAKLFGGLSAGLALRVLGASVASDRAATAVEKFVQDPFSIFAEDTPLSE